MLFSCNVEQNKRVMISGGAAGAGSVRGHMLVCQLARTSRLWVFAAPSLIAAMTVFGDRGSFNDDTACGSGTSCIRCGLPTGPALSLSP